MPLVWCAFQFHDRCHLFLIFHTYGTSAKKFRLVICVYEFVRLPLTLPKYRSDLQLFDVMTLVLALMS